MADVKISGLPASTTPLAGTEVLPIVQSGATKQVSVANLTAGRAISASSVTASTGNFVVGTSGQGVDFSATPGTGTSELLADYEEGTWTPTYVTTGGSFVYSLATGRYTKIGRRVFLNFSISTSSATVGSSNVQIGGLPFALLGAISTRSSSAIGYSDAFLVNNPNGIFVLEGSTNVYLSFKATSNGVSANLQATSLTTGAGNSIFASFEYDAA